MWLRIAKLGDLPVDITPHVLRHSFASLATDLGFNEPTIASLLGHKTHSITSRYFHSSDAVLLTAADAVANATMKLMTSDRAQPQLLDQRGDGSVVWDGITSPLVFSSHEMAARRLDQECRPVITDMRLTSLTLAADTFSNRAVSRTPRPSSRAARIRCTVNCVVLGLPRRLPDDLARSRPTITRSRIIDLSNSLNTPNMPNSARPDGVEVSSACWCR
jgi:hypothetical protein